MLLAELLIIPQEEDVIVIFEYIQRDACKNLWTNT